MSPFDLFVGVDWSGERGPAVRRLQVAVCPAGDAPPVLVGNPAGGAWTRPDFAAWLLGQAEETRVLCGVDFSFCFPREDLGAYFPDYPDDPAGHAAFWALVERLCAADGGFFGGAFADAPALACHFRRGRDTGGRYRRRLRVTEALTQTRGLGTVESVFNLVGARQVGKGSLAGMRLLRWLKRQPAAVAVWPFDEIGAARLALVETFPTAFVRMAGQGAGKVRDAARLNRVLGHFGSRPVPTPDALTDDMTDALITAAALRYLTPHPGMWRPPDLSDSVRRFEGWTFGIV
ncbi:MAG: hypothetical protein GC201_18665 [Alphaproteobacteria bacterium]|nr:hypothetical protein [Alphaproteobacteria bacterium]